LLPAGVHEGVFLGARAEEVPVLHAHDRCHRLGLGELPWRHPGNPEVANQAGFAELGEGAEVLGERGHARHDAQVHHAEMVAAELAQVLLDLAAELSGRGPGSPLARRVAGRADLGDDDQVVRIRRERRVDQLVGGPERGEVEGGGVDVVDAEFDSAAQYRDGLGAVAGGGVGPEGLPGLR
jgi:hypothetical protein